jgi:uncharacterized protein YegL
VRSQILCTDGEFSAESLEETLNLVSDLKNQGVWIIAVGIGNQVDFSQLQQVATGNEFVFVSKAIANALAL